MSSHIFLNYSNYLFARFFVNDILQIFLLTHVFVDSLLVLKLRDCLVKYSSLLALFV